MMEKRHPIHVKFLGLIRHKKKKTYLVSVLWSDGNEIIVYRSFSDFRKLQKALQRKFITPSRFRKSEDILPKFKDAPLKFIRNRKENRCMQRLKLLEKYCMELLETKEDISQCEDLIQFFLPQANDLEPSFPKNSFIILPSVVEPEDNEAMKKRDSVSSIIQPLVPETYLCKDAYDTKDVKNRPFKVNKNDHLEVLIKDPSGWWLVENAERRISWFPAPYLEKCTVEEDEESEESDDVFLYYAVRGYEAKESDEISLNIGAVVEAVQKSDDGWWLIRYNGKVGYVPSMYLQVYCNPHMKFQKLQSKEMYASTPNLFSARNGVQVDSFPLKQMRRFSSDDQSVKANVINNKNLTRLSKRKSRSFGSFPVTCEMHVQNFHSNKTSPENLSLSSDCSNSGSTSTSEVGSPEENLHCVLFSDFEDQIQKHKSSTMNKESTLQMVPSDHSSNSKTVSTFPYQKTPTVPPRPAIHEILRKCTTLTIQAAQTIDKNM